MTIPSASYDQHVAEYRPISRVAVVAGAAGLASSAALLHPVLWFIPALALLLGLIGVRQIRRANGTITGRPFAMLGICLGLLFGTWVLTNHFATNYLIGRQARVAADRWLELFKIGALRHAHQWTLGYVSRQNPGVSLEEFYQPGGTQEPSFRRFFEQQPAQRLMEVTEDDQFRFVARLDVTTERLNTYVTLRYRLTPARGDQPLDFLVVMRRFKDPETYEKSWMVHAVSTVDAVERID